MDAYTYYKKQIEVFEKFNTPKEFQAFISNMAYERGHHYGYEECFNILRDIASDMEEPILNFKNRLASKG